MGLLSKAHWLTKHLTRASRSNKKSIQMNFVALSFWIFLMSALAVIYGAGGNEGRRFSLAILGAVIATFAVNFALGFLKAQPIVLLVDVGLLGYVFMLANHSKAYWPIWFVGFHLIGVSSGIAYAIFSASIPELYIDTSGIWAVPALGAAAIGVMLDRLAFRKMSSSYITNHTSV